MSRSIVMAAAPQVGLQSPWNPGCMGASDPVRWTIANAVEGDMAEPLSADDRRRAAQMAAAQAGDSSTYATLLRECVPLIRTFARRRGITDDRIDDVVQDTLFTVHRARHTYDPQRSFTAWLRVISERRAIDVMRRSRRVGAREIHAPLHYESHADDGADPMRGLAGAEAGRRVASALTTLPPRQREAVRALALEERSLAEVAAATGRTKVSLKVNLHRALTALRLRLGEES